MLKKIYHITVYLSIIFSFVYYSLEIYLRKLYGLCNIPSLFDDPKDLGVNFYLEFAKVSLVLNYLIVLPVGFILTIVCAWKKNIHRDSMILFLINFVFVYLNHFYLHLGLEDWIFD